MAHVRVYNDTHYDVVVARAGGYAGTTALSPRMTLEWYVQRDRAFFLEKNAGNPTSVGQDSYVVTASLEVYKIDEYSNGTISLTFLGGSDDFAPAITGAIQQQAPSLIFTDEYNEGRFAAKENS